MKINLRNLNFIFLTFLSIILGASQTLFAQQDSIHTINIFSGAPQPGDGPSKIAGFGDVAANLVAATEIKKRHPELHVRLIVTSAKGRFDSLIPTTNEILKIMEPGLDPQKTNVVQQCEGVDVIFLSYDFAEALDESKIKNLPAMFRDMELQLPMLIPKADVNLNFSYFPESAPVLRINAPLSIGIEELYGNTKPINVVLAAKEGTVQGNFVELSSGPHALGFMLVRERIPKIIALDSIRDWVQKAGISESFTPLIAYTAGWQAVQVYVDALSMLQPRGHFVLFAKDFPQVDMSSLPENIKFVPFKGMPHKVMRAIIQETPFSPLVTGDISLGQALSSATDEKTFVYEAPEWKLDNSEGIQKKLAQDLGLKPHDLESLFLKQESLMKLDRAGLRQKGVELARLMGNVSLQKQLYETLQSRKESWDLIDNTLMVARGVLSETSTKDSIVANDIATEIKKRFKKAPQEEKLPLSFVLKSKVGSLFQKCSLLLEWH